MTLKTISRYHPEFIDDFDPDVYGYVGKAVRMASYKNSRYGQEGYVTFQVSEGYVNVQYQDGQVFTANVGWLKFLDEDF